MRESTTRWRSARSDRLPCTRPHGWDATLACESRINAALGSRFTSTSNEPLRNALHSKVRSASSLIFEVGIHSGQRHHRSILYLTDGSRNTMIARRPEKCAKSAQLRQSDLSHSPIRIAMAPQYESVRHTTGETHTFAPAIQEGKHVAEPIEAWDSATDRIGDARAMFHRTLSHWAMDILEMRRRGVDRLAWSSRDADADVWPDALAA